VRWPSRHVAWSALQLPRVPRPLRFGSQTRVHQQARFMAPSHSKNDHAVALQGYFGYHLFGLLWTNQVIVGFGYVVIAHCIGQYYWYRGIRAQMSSIPVLTGMRTALRYHMGSTAFGGFVVAVIQFVRIALEYVDRKTKKMQQGNPLAKWCMCCLRYCLWCAPCPALRAATAPPRARRRCDAIDIQAHTHCLL
jgi:Plasma-membrane choline transporter